MFRKIVLSIGAGLFLMSGIFAANYGDKAVKSFQTKITPTPKAAKSPKKDAPPMMEPPTVAPTAEPTAVPTASPNPSDPTPTPAPTATPKNPSDPIPTPSVSPSPGEAPMMPSPTPPVL